MIKIETNPCGKCHSTEQVLTIEGKMTYIRCACHRGCGAEGYDKAIDYWNATNPISQPLLAGAKVGDLCQLRNGAYTQLKDYLDPPRKIGEPLWMADNQNAYYLNGRHDKHKEEQIDIIHTEALAPEGTAEWAWQMWMLGKMPIPEGMEKHLFPNKEKLEESIWGHNREYWSTHKADFINIGGRLRWRIYEPTPKITDTPPRTPTIEERVTACEKWIYEHETMTARQQVRTGYL